VNDVRDVAVVGSNVWVAAVVGRDGVLLRRSGSAWREVVRVRSAGGGPAALARVAVADLSVVAVGGDGAAGVIVFSAVSGARSKTIRPRRLDSATAVAKASGEILVTGYRAPSGVVENATGILLRTNAQGARIRHRAFEGTTQLLDVAFRSRKAGYIIASTGRGDQVWKSRTGGRTWTRLRGPQDLTVERLVEGGSSYAVGGSGLLRVP
jgi:hypothetical protein